MKLRVIFFVLMTSISGISNAAKVPAPTKLLPKPIVFIDLQKIESAWLGWNDSQTYYDKYAKIGSVADDIAKQLGACAIISERRILLQIFPYESNYDLTDPKYDITQKVIDALNKDLLDEAAKAKETQKKLMPQARLRYAILNNSPEEIKESVKIGANVNNPINGKAPMFWAVVLKKTKAVECLLSLGAKADEALISFALKVSDAKSAFLIAKRCGADINKSYLVAYGQQQSLLQHVVYGGYSDDQNEKVNLILDFVRNGADISGEFNINSCKNFKDVVVEFLNGAQNNKTIINKVLELMQEVINRAGCNVNDFWFVGDGWNPSTIYSYKEALELLIKNGANPNYVACDLGGNKGTFRTPLIDALRSGNPAAVKFLLDSGANVNQKAKPIWNKEPITPLSFALEDPNVSRNTQMVELLLEYGATL